MGAIDTFLQSHVAGGLEPGEAIRGMAHIRQPYKFTLLGMPESQTEHLAVATDRRLIIFTTELGGLLVPVLKPVATGLCEWRYFDLARVHNERSKRPIVHSGGQCVEMTLIPHPHVGPFPSANTGDSQRRYDIYLAAEGLDSQGAFFQQFPQWLETSVSAGAFPMPPQRRAEIDAKLAAEVAQRSAERAANERQYAELSAKAKAAGPRVLVAIGATIVFGVGAVPAYLGIDQMRRQSNNLEAAETSIKNVDRDLAWLRSKAPLPVRCQDSGSVELEYAQVGKPQACGCELNWAKDPPPLRPGWRRFPTSPEGWIPDCPPEAVYVAERKLRQKTIREIDENWREGLLFLLVGGLIAIAALVGGAIGWKKLGRKTASVKA